MFDLSGQRSSGAHPLDEIPITALRGAYARLFFFALDKFQSFLSVEIWYQEIVSLFEKWEWTMPVCLLVRNKLDLDRKVESVNGMSWIENYPIFRAYHEVSLLTGENVPLLVDELREIIVNKE